MIKNIVFDFGGVLVTYDFYRFFLPHFQSHEKTVAFMKEVLTKEVGDDLDRELVPFRVYMAGLKEKWPQYAEALDLMDRDYVHIVTGEMPGMTELMQRLKSQGYRLLGLSNWSSKVYEVMEKYPIFQLLEGSVISTEVKQLKPEADIYHTLLERFQALPEECVFIDDKLPNIEGCRQVGMHGILFQSTAQLEEELRKLGVL